MNARVPVLACRDLKKSYVMGETEVRALRGVNMELHQGEYLAVTGPSGSGKSTLLNLLGLLDRATSGELLVRGRATSGLSDGELAELRNRSIGFVFQTFNLLARVSARDNVALPLVYAGIGLNERRERAEHMLDLVGLGDRVDHKPSELSGGQRQRVAVARALVTEPDLLLADEPTGNLDQATGKEILALFDELHRQGRTLLVITHDEQVAERAGRRLHVVDGRIVELDAA